MGEKKAEGVPGRHRGDIDAQQGELPSEWELERMEPFPVRSSLRFWPGGGLLKKSCKSWGLEKSRNCEARIWTVHLAVEISPGGSQEAG